MKNLRINSQRLLDRIHSLAKIGALQGGGVKRLALTDEDKAARDRVKKWMIDLGLDVTVDCMGNCVGIRPGEKDGPPVMAGSHIDSVATGGPYDGCLGVLAGLEAVHTLNEAGVTTKHPLAVAFFTNEEGVRFAPDMMGSMAHQGLLDAQDMLKIKGIDGKTVGEELARIGYNGPVPCRTLTPRAYVELHVEQGPVLERENLRIGAVESVQGISWSQITLTGVSNHAGTTPMNLRRDAGLGAARITAFVRDMAVQMGGAQVATVGRLEIQPQMINVVPDRAVLTVDLRNTDDVQLKQAETDLEQFVRDMAKKEGLEAKMKRLARFLPTPFDPNVVDLVEKCAGELGVSARRMPSGAGHDAQSFAPNCPTGMIFVPSVGGISHNIREYTEPGDIALGANVLLQVLLELAS